MSQESLLNLLLRVNNNPVQRRELFEGLDSYAKGLRRNPLPVGDYKTFLKTVHDIYIRSESAVKSELLRIIRYGFVTPAHGDEIITEEVHWLVISSFEREGGELTERMQALKLMKQFIAVAPMEFPFGFARSLVATSAQTGDGFRRVAIETLRELALANSYLVACCNGMKVLVEAAVDPALHDAADSLLLSVLHLVSQPSSRVNINMALDLRTLLSAFTDMDATEGKEYRARLAAAKAAVITLMRTWVGIVHLTSDPLGLRVLVGLLRDNKVAPLVQDVVLDTLTELFAPVVVKNKQLRIENSRMNEVIQQQSTLTLDATPSGQRATGSGVSAFTATGTRSSVTVAAPPAVAESSWSSMFGGSRASMSRASVSGRPSAGDLGMADGTDSERRMSRGFSSFFNKGSTKSAPSNVAPIVPPTSSSTPGLEEGSECSSPRDSADGDELAPASAVNAALRGLAGGKAAVGADFIFNLMNDYAAVLCSAFMHVDVISSLCFLGSHGETALASKACVLLVNILTVICGIFPEEKCTELLEIPALVEYASTVSNSNMMVARSMKATEILASVAEAFSNFFAKHKMNRNFPDAEFAPLGQESEKQPFATTKPPTQSHMQPTDSVKAAAQPDGPGQGASLFLSGGLKPFGPSAASGRPSIAWVAADLKNSCKPRVDGLLLSYRGVSASTDLMYDLRHAITAAIDKTEFGRQMERSLVIGKEGKEPLKWDWPIIDDMLEYSFKNPERLSDALKTKWVKRVSGFYRCTVDEKAYFANSEWDYGNIMFLECACNMYHVLVGCDAGVMFLSGGDRRGMLFNEMSYELEQLVSSTTRCGWNGMGNATKNVFRMSSCTQTLAREYFTLLGRMTNTASGRKLLDSTQVFQHLSMLGHSRSLDYCSRLALTALSFTDNGHFSRNLLQIFTTSGGCSRELRGYTHTLLRALLRKSRHTEFANWGMEMMVTQMMYFPSASLAKVLEEAAQDQHYLRSLVEKKANFVGVPEAEKVLLRYCSIPAGIAFLQELDWLDGALERWEKTGNDAYVGTVERALARALSSSAEKARAREVATPIPVQADVFYTPTPTSALECGVCVDLEGLLRIPWNIEAKLSTSPQQQPGVTAGLSDWEYLKIDSFLDASELVSTACGEASSDMARVVRVRGLVLDGAGVTSGYRVDASRTVACALLCGVNPVLRSGKVVRLSADSAKYARAREKRAKVVQQLKVDQMRASGSNFRGSMVAAPVEGLVEPELPITFQYETQHDWSLCKPSHRGGRVTELPDDRFAVEVPGEPVVFIFARSLTPPKTTEVDTSASTPKKPSARRDTGAAYLVEVHYLLRLWTDQDAFVPIPRHLYGELARSKKGAAMLSLVPEQGGHSTVQRLLSVAEDEMAAPDKRRAALWALGQIGSTEHGFGAITAERPSFVRFVIAQAVGAPNYSLRGTGFFILGLLGRSRGGAFCLAQEDWDVSPQVGVAVAVPRDVSALFQTPGPEAVVDPIPAVSGLDIGGLHRAGFVTANCVRSLRPCVAPSTTAPNQKEGSRLPPKSPVNPVSMPPLPPQATTAAVELGIAPTGASGLTINIAQSGASSPDIPPTSDEMTELLVLNSIVKLSGQILYKEGATHLKELKRQGSSVFQSRRLLRAVHELFSSYSFKLPTRRFILDLFTLTACARSRLPTTGSGSQLASCGSPTGFQRSSSGISMGEYMPDVNASPA